MKCFKINIYILYSAMPKNIDIKNCDPIIKIYCDKRKRVWYKNINKCNKLIKNPNTHILYNDKMGKQNILSKYDYIGPDLNNVPCNSIDEAKNLNTMKYFKIDLSNMVAGLTDQKSKFIHILKYSYHNNLKLIKPIFILEKIHNNNNKIVTDLSKYFDLDKITINDKQFILYDDNINFKKETINYTYFKRNIYSSNGCLINMHNLPGRVNVPYKKDIINIAKNISSKLGDYMCIHVRRGDKIKESSSTRHPTLDIDTQPKNIKKIINKYKPNSIYIMTNKINELKPLQNIKNLYFYTHFNLLKNINDNYYLYCIEINIMKLAKIRCSTFNTKKKYYDCYLTNYFGWQ